MSNHAEITARDEKISSLENRISELEKLLKYYEERFLLSQKRRFAPSTEKSMYDQIRMDFAEATAALLEAEGEAAEVESVKEYSRKKRVRAATLPENLPTEEILCELPEDERSCPQCGCDLHVIGHEYRKELVVIPAKVMVRKYAACTYACKTCAQTSERTPIVKAPMPKPVLKGSNASPEFIAYTAHQKFMMGIPLYRQEAEWARQGISLSRQTMSNWLILSVQKWLRPVARELRRRLLLRDVLHADETTFQVLHEPGKAASSKSYLWCYRTSGDVDEPIVVAEYKPDRRKENPKDFLKSFSGYLHTDGYEAYHALPEGIVVVGCWAHARRKWDEALKIVPVMAREGSVELRGKQYCDQLFALEKKFADLKAEDRHMARLEQLKSVMEAFYAWALHIQARPKSALGKAVAYMFSQRAYLQNILLDGRLEISNNRAERTIKPFVISRKNFLFANTPDGAEAAAILFSLIETAKETGVNPFQYLTYVFTVAPNVDMYDPQCLGSLLPAGYKKAHCP